MKSVLAGSTQLVLEKTEPRALQAGGPPAEEDGEANRSHVQVLSDFSLSCEPLKPLKVLKLRKNIVQFEF